MKYLAVFQLDDFQSATDFASKAKAEEYITTIAKAARAKALKNNETDDFLITIADNAASLTAKITPVDTTIKYRLAYYKNGELLETSHFDQRKAAVQRADQILDELGYEAAADEDALGHWQIANHEQNLAVDIKLQLVLVGSDDHIVESYNAADMKYVCQNFTAIQAQLAATDAIATQASLQDARKKGLTNLGIGLAIAAVGAIISLISYNSARPGERYTIYTGIIVIGIIDAICGIYYLINPKAALPKDKKKRK